MSKRASPSVVGGFVVGAVVLGIGGVLAFGSGSWFETQLKVVSHFPSSLAGLDEGAAVRFRGIKVGTVSRIRAVWSETTEEIRIPVYYELDGDSISTDTSSGQVPWGDPHERLDYLIKKGLRAELALDSFVTGKLYIALDFRPGEPAHLQGSAELREIPSSEAGLSKLKKKLEDLPIDELVTSAVTSVHAIEDLLTDPRIGMILDDLQRVLTKLEARIDPVADSLQTTLADARVLMHDADAELEAVSAELRKLLAMADSSIGPVTESALTALGEAQAASQKIGRFVGDDYSLFYRLSDLLDEVTGAARAVRVLAAYLERHPEAILSGRGKK